MINQNEDLILQEKLDNPDSIEAGRRAEELCRQIPAARNEYEDFQTLFHHLETKFSPGPEDEPTTSSLDNLMQQISQHDEGNKQHQFLPDWLSPAIILRFALGGAFVLAVIFAVMPTRGPEGLKPPAAHKTDLFNLETMSVLIAPESESDLSIDGQNRKVTDGSTLKSQATYKLNNTAELAISSIHGLISFKNQASFSLQNNEIRIATGDIYCNLKGNHQGFKITTQYGSIVPVGTKFTVSVRATCVKVHLLAGKLLLTSIRGNEKIISDSTPVFILPGGEFSDKPASREEAEFQRVPANPGIQMSPASQPEPPKKAPDTILDTL